MFKITMNISEETKAFIRSQDGMGERLKTELGRGISQGVQEIAAHLQLKYLSGTYGNTPGGGESPLAVRSPQGLRNSTTAGMDTQLAGWVGVVGPAARYAQVQLGEGDTTIKPKNGKFLWIPMPDNRTPGGLQKMSPTEAMSKTGPTGLRLLKFIEAHGPAGGLLAFLPDSSREYKSSKYTRGKKRGQERGSFLFMLLTSVTVHGTGALVKSVQDKAGRLHELLREGTTRALAGDGGGAA